MATLQTVVTVILLLMLLLILIFLFYLFKPWRFFFRSPSRSSLKVAVGELERPLVREEGDANDANLPSNNNSNNQSNELARDYDLEGACHPNEVHFRSPRSLGLVRKPRLPIRNAPPQGDALVLDVMSADSVDVGQTLRLSPALLAEAQKHHHQHQHLQNNRVLDSLERDILGQRSCLTLEVISGPSRGIRCSVQSMNSAGLPLTLGRVPPSDLVIKDSEVSGKHAMINWNLDKMKWELVDMGSLNGTLLNSRPINHPDTGSRLWGDPVNLADGDIITLGTTSNISVHVTAQNQQRIPFGVGMASDPMALRRRAK